MMVDPRGQPAQPLYRMISVTFTLLPAELHTGNFTSSHPSFGGYRCNLRHDQLVHLGSPPVSFLMRLLDGALVSAKARCGS
jgi:hypothetical protein